MAPAGKRLFVHPAKDLAHEHYFSSICACMSHLWEHLAWRQAWQKGAGAGLGAQGFASVSPEINCHPLVVDAAGYGV
eukprot:1158598-Pelagomonas_calceolata.AAC.8